MNYPEVLKARMVRRMAGPQRQSAAQLSAETGISQPTLSRWLREAGQSVSKASKNALDEAEVSASSRPRRPRDLSPLERAQAVLEVSKLSGEARGIYLRQQGLHEEHVEAWSSALEDALGAAPKRPIKPEKGDSQRVRQLEKELLRKDRALAEAAALIVLQKKTAILFGEAEEESTPRRNGR